MDLSASGQYAGKLKTNMGMQAQISPSLSANQSY